MPTLPFDREIVYPLELPSSGDINIGQASILRGVFDYMLRLYGRRTSVASPFTVGKTGFIGDSFYCYAPGAMFVNVNSGLGMFYDPAGQTASLGGVSGLDDLSVYKPMPLTAFHSFAVPAAPAIGQERWDIVQVKYRRERIDSQVRSVYNAVTKVFDPTALLKTLGVSIDGDVETIAAAGVPSKSLVYKTGVAALVGGAPTPPAVDAGYVQLARVYVNDPGAGASIGQEDILDYRPLLFEGNHLRANFYVSIGTAGGAFPAVQELDAPAGVRVVCVADPATYGGSAAYGSMDVYLFAGSEVGAGIGLTVAAQATNTPQTLAPGPALMLNAYVSDMTAGTVNAALQAQLIDPLQASPVLGIAVGQPYLTFKLWALCDSQVGGFVTPAAAPYLSVRYYVRISAARQ